MRKIYTLVLGLFVASFLFSGCDDLTTIDIDFALATDHSLDVIGTTQSMSVTQSVDLKENEEFKKHQDKITNANVDSVQYRIENYNNAPTTMLNGSLDVAATPTSTKTLLYAITNWNIQDEETRTANDTWVTIPLNQAGKDMLASLIKNDPHAATISLTGSTTEMPANFTIRFKIHWKMTASEDVI